MLQVHTSCTTAVASHSSCLVWTTWWCMGVRPKHRIVPLQYAANPLHNGNLQIHAGHLTGAQVVRCRVINYENDIGMTLLMASFTVASQDASSGHGMTTIPQTTAHVDVQELPRATRYSRHRVRRWKLAPHRCARSGRGNGWGKLRSCNRQGNDSSCRRWLVLFTGWWHALIASGGPGQ